MNNNESQVGLDTPLIDGNESIVAQLIARAKRRGYITAGEVEAALPQERMSSDQIEEIMAAISEMGVKIVQDSEDEDPDA